MKISIKNVIFYVLTFFLVTYILLETFAPDKTVDILGFKSYVIVTGSMEPEIMINDLVVIRKVKEENLDINDKITFFVYISEFGEEVAVTHYIGDIEEIYGQKVYRTQSAGGNWDTWLDENDDQIDITFDNIEGKVVLVIPNMGDVVNILKDPISIGLIAVNGIIIYSLIKAFKRKENVEEEKK